EVLFLGHCLVLVIILFLFFFFFQAEDGIRDLTVTGVQTCALPIYRRRCLPCQTAAPITSVCTPSTSRVVPNCSQDPGTLPRHIPHPAAARGLSTPGSMQNVRHCCCRGA